MSPEQVRGEDATPASDIFAWGVMAFQCLTGVMPFGEGEPTSVMYRIVNEDPANLIELRPDTPPHLVQVIATCLAKNPAERFADADALLAALGNQGAASLTPSGTRRSKKPALIALGSVIAVAVVIIAVLLLLPKKGTVPSAAPLSSSSPTAATSPSVASPTAESKAPTEKPRQPVGLKTSVKGFDIHLSWNQPADHPGISYDVYRDRKKRAESVKLTWIDEDVNPGTTHSYYVVATDGGQSSVRSVPRKQSVPLPPLSDARINGTYVMRTTVVQARNFNGGTKGNWEWKFAAQCTEGPCDANLRVWDVSDWSELGYFTRKGAVYDGWVDVLNYYFCSGGGGARVNLKLNVTHARAINGQWRATEINGTANVTFPFTTCRNRVQLSVNGHLRGV